MVQEGADIDTENESNKNKKGARKTRGKGEWRAPNVNIVELFCKTIQFLPRPQLHVVLSFFGNVKAWVSMSLFQSTHTGRFLALQHQSVPHHRNNVQRRNSDQNEQDC